MFRRDHFPEARHLFEGVLEKRFPGLATTRDGKYRFSIPDRLRTEGVAGHNRVHPVLDAVVDDCFERRKWRLGRNLERNWIRTPLQFHEKRLDRVRVVGENRLDVFALLVVGAGRIHFDETDGQGAVVLVQHPTEFPQFARFRGSETQVHIGRDVSPHLADERRFVFEERLQALVPEANGVEARFGLRIPK